MSLLSDAEVAGRQSQRANRRTGGLAESYVYTNAVTENKDQLTRPWHLNRGIIFFS